MIEQAKAYLRQMALSGEVQHGPLSTIAALSGVPLRELKFSIKHHTLPSPAAVQRLVTSIGVSEPEIQLLFGAADARLKYRLAEHAEEIASLLGASTKSRQTAIARKPDFQTKLGSLWQVDCLDFLPAQADESVDLVFADPPFNLDKVYPSGIDDDREVGVYFEWCEQWLTECIRVMKNGGSLFLWNLPKWNSVLSGFLSQRLTFRHWIAVDIKYSLPIRGRFYPSHYSLLYYCKGSKPNTFKPDRLPMPVCPHCHGDLRDYGGYKHRMNPRGVNIPDVWTDIPPVRHAKYKKRSGANELPIRLLDRVMEAASNPGDLVLDPFGGSGSTYAVAELKNRRWLGCEVGPIADIIQRFGNLQDDRDHLARIRAGVNCLFTDQVRSIRQKKGLWTDETVRPPKTRSKGQDIPDDLFPMAELFDET